MKLVLLILFVASAASYKPVPEEPSNDPPQPPKNPSKTNNAQSSSRSESSSSASSSSTSSSSSSSQSSTSSYSSYSSTNGTKPRPIKCGVNEYAVPCKTLCPPQNCDIAYTDYACDPNPKCIPGCDCIKDHLRNDEKICVFNENCPRQGGVDPACTYNKCTPTCSIPYPQDCPADSNPCNCAPGTLISEEGGKCVEREECQKYANCKGDYNASYTNCPIACPSTCAKPNAEYCNTSCGKYGCACNSGYILSEINGKCIKPEDCPGGNVCGKNETFVSCSIKCPTIYCPRNDDRAIIACSPPYPCPSGCSCKGNYRRKSVEEDICILASDCPPVKCTRPNEEWNSCPKPCFSDYCSTRNKVTKPEDCSYSTGYCNPQCVCKQGFYRNGTDICVTAEECPSDN